jgi:hypothetical protein
MAALIVALLFVAAPIVIASLLLPGDKPGWLLILDFAGLGCGALLLLAGVLVWRGKQARRLRLAGVSLLMLASLVMVSFALVLVPLALIAAPSLKTQRG